MRIFLKSGRRVLTWETTTGEWRDWARKEDGDLTGVAWPPSHLEKAEVSDLGRKLFSDVVQWMSNTAIDLASFERIERQDEEIATTLSSTLQKEFQAFLKLVPSQAESYLRTAIAVGLEVVRAERKRLA